MSGLIGTGQLVRLFLRLDRVHLPLWIVGIVGIVAASASAVQGLYTTPELRAGYAATVTNSPAAIAMSGPPQALDTVGGITLFEINLTAAVGVSLMAIFLTVRHTRAEEEAGRTELLRAGVLGRHAPLAAALIVVGGASLLVGLLLAASLTGLGLPASGSMLFGSSMACLGVVFCAVTAVAAQLTEHARAALGMSVAVLGVAWALRSLGDVRESALTWASPVGWVQAVHAFGAERWWPLLLPVATAVGLTAVAVELTRRRDVGAGLVPPRPGPARASHLLSSVPGLALRQQRSSLLWWSVGLFLAGLAFGSFGEEVTTMLEDNPELGELLGGGGDDLVAGYFGLILLILVLIVACFTVSSVQRLRSEEAAARAELVLATRTPRASWQLGWLGVTAVGTVLVTLATGVGVAVADTLVSGSAERFGELLAATAAYLPAIAVIGGLAAALHGWAPRLSLLVWVVLAGCFVVGWLGDLLEIPEAVRNLSPFNLTPRMPLESMDWGVALSLSVLAGLLLALAVLGFRRRDVGVA
ncbi:polyketide antibiotic transporter [Ornithinimicrobium sp. F0845]|uniref:ABC transporter permease n=1 Tax=Ornithinimicrobium sp. F0845 TaxID=2926412 RepID=UPI001FF1E28A|nr:polyketide antibiotic transporter [Ornithinimicrobium sp. F0845]MCK0113857.1 polyketide antibiotic transporter [Ornithinimicrobium sp. F0845]